MTESHNYSNPRIVISGLRGGSGKTILSLCLVASLRKKEIKVIPFKKGPDYIDAGWLAKAAGTPCYNLDLFMMTPEQALQSFVAHTYHFVNAECGLRLPAGAGNAESNSELRTPNSELLRQIALIEGNRGLYDGFDHKGTYSTAELAKLLKAPVIIVIDCTKATNTIAAMVLGCQKMDPDVPISGIVLNQIATNRQEALIRRAIHERCALPVVGAIPRLKKDPFPERHMGLTPFQEYTDIERSLAAVLEIGEKYVDVDGILKIAREATTLKIAECGLQNAELTNSEPRNAECGMRLPAGAGNAELKNSEIRNPKSAIKIGIIRDSAFQFYYQENFEALEKRGAQLIEINALKATDLPEIDALYIGGGFPETNALALAENTAFRNSLRDAIEKGLPVYAECGGLMYLGESLI
ncbi:MAG: cobyrinate a,c-diamide synthase, partial [Nitrospirae bacterium]|nr:cobyrinate a,c-diamide synthase [Nitrospirota bacterium]